MKKLIVILLVLISTNSFAQEKLGLLIIAHGSPVKQWNQPVLDIENQVKELLKTKRRDTSNKNFVDLISFLIFNSILSFLVINILLSQNYSDKEFKICFL